MRKFCLIKFNRHSYLVLTFGNYTMKLCTSTDASVCVDYKAGAFFFSCTHKQLHYCRCHCGNAS
jgi:hypothetical protein